MTEMQKAIISMDPGVNGAMVIWRKDKMPPLVHGWARTGRLNWQLIKIIIEVLEDYVEQYDVGTIVLERPSPHGQMRGGGFQQVLFDDIKTWCESHDIKFKFIAPTSVKAKVAGNGRATKDQVARAVIEFFESRNRVIEGLTNEHKFDAAAIGIAYMKRRD